MTPPAATQSDPTRSLTSPDWATCPLDELWAGVEAANIDMLTPRPVRVRVAGRVTEPSSSVRVQMQAGEPAANS